MNYFLEGIHNLLSSRLRSLLALTGILIGTCSVVAMMLGGKLATEAALSQFQTLGTDLLEVSILSSSEKNTAKNTRQLTPKDIDGIMRINPMILTTAPYTLSYPMLRFQGHRLQGNVLGVTADFSALMKTRQMSGRFISPHDDHAFYCVIGAGLAEKIRNFSLESPSGHFIQAGHVLFKIIGVLQPWPENIFLPVNLDNAILIPVETALITDHSAGLRNLVVKVRPDASVTATGKWLEHALQERLPERRIFVRSPEELITRIRKQSDILTVFLGLTGGITLLVGGIGIMNIMLVSVLERKREIGIRRAVGATGRDIRNLFLAEAVLLSLLGGIPGIVLGLLAGRVFALYWQWPFHFFLLPPLAGFTVATLTGILAGLYPAVRAARLTPVTALRAD